MNTKSEVQYDELPIAALVALAEKGDVLAQTTLGKKYDQDDGRESYTKAVAWYLKAAEQGYAVAQYKLGHLYIVGREGVPRDYKKAFAWYHKAASQGNVDAQGELGSMYDHAEGVPQDYKQAVYWWRKAAEQGDGYAQFQLGRMYRDGHGVERDMVIAYMLFDLAAAGGDSSSGDFRTKLMSEMTPRQIDEGRTLSSQWRVGASLPAFSKFRAEKVSIPVQETFGQVKIKNCEPPTGKNLRYSDNCNNGDCIRTFENGCPKRFRAPYCFDALKERWTWNPNGC